MKRNFSHFLLLWILFFSFPGCRQKSAFIPGNTTGEKRQPTETVLTAGNIINVGIVRWHTDEARYRQALSLNKKGLDVYKKGRITAAADLFRDAILADSTYMYSHYNLACMLSLLKGQGKKVDDDELYDELDIALGMDSVSPETEKNWVVSRLQTDTDLDPVRNETRFRALPGIELPAKISTRDLIQGVWIDNNNQYTLEFREDGSFFYRCKSVSDSAREGSWNLNKGTGLFTLDCSELIYTFYNAKKNETITNKTNTLEFDPFQLVIKLIDTAGNERETAVILHRKTAPLQRALQKMDIKQLAGLFSQNIIPAYEESPPPGQKYLLEEVLDSRRMALIRLFIGKQGVWPYPCLYIPNDHPAYTLAEEFRERSSRALLQEAARQAEFSENWYRELLAHPLSAVFPSYTDTSAMGGGSSNQFYPLGYNNWHLAFLGSDYVSAAPLTAYSVFIFDVAGNNMSQVSDIGDITPCMEKFPESAMDENDAGIRMIMNREKNWVPVLREYGITIKKEALPLSSFPFRLRGEKIDCIIEKQDDVPEGTAFMGSNFSIKINASEIASFIALDCKVPGYMLLGESGAEYLVVFILTVEWGFEGEHDTYIHLISEPLGAR